MEASVHNEKGVRSTVDIEATNGSTTHNICGILIMECARKSNRHMRSRPQRDRRIKEVAEAPLQKFIFL